MRLFRIDKSQASRKTCKDNGNVFVKLILCLQLTAVNSVVFTVKAVDADGDMIAYIIDGSSVRSTRHYTYFCSCPDHFLKN